ncbi:MAG: nitrile hydratase subunit beta [Solirubrobacterales bacterium]|nr:nitrile hydratase subunit beta [Solirubrobacterales bacterium]
MNGVHDLGGMEGLGAVDPPAQEPVFYNDWERRTFAMFIPFVLSGANLDMFRHGIERLHPVQYLTGRYYEHWLHTFESNLVAKGVISEEELEQRTQHYLEHPDEAMPDGGDADQAEHYLKIYEAGASTRRETSNETPAFGVGDRVRVKNIHPSGHTRCARYVRGKEGVVTEVYDAFVFPDTNSKEQGEDPARVYNVEFDSTELWGSGNAERHKVLFDLWEPYLEAA